jgi:hypothetical protein
LSSSSGSVDEADNQERRVMMTMIIVMMFLTVAVLRWRCCDINDNDEDVYIYVIDYETNKQLVMCVTDYSRDVLDV